MGISQSKQRSPQDTTSAQLPESSDCSTSTNNCYQCIVHCNTNRDNNSNHDSDAHDTDKIVRFRIDTKTGRKTLIYDKFGQLLRRINANFLGQNQQEYTDQQIDQQFDKIISDFQKGVINVTSYDSMNYGVAPLNFAHLRIEAIKLEMEHYEKNKTSIDIENQKQFKASNITALNSISKNQQAVDILIRRNLMLIPEELYPSGNEIDVDMDTGTTLLTQTTKKVDSNLKDHDETKTDINNHANLNDDTVNDQTKKKMTTIQEDINESGEEKGSDSDTQNDDIFDPETDKEKYFQQDSVPSESPSTLVREDQHRREIGGQVNPSKFEIPSNTQYWNRGAESHYQDNSRETGQLQDHSDHGPSPYSSIIESDSDFLPKRQFSKDLDQQQKRIYHQLEKRKRKLASHKEFLNIIKTQLPNHGRSDTRIPGNTIYTTNFTCKGMYLHEAIQEIQLWLDFWISLRQLYLPLRKLRPFVNGDKGKCNREDGSFNLRLYSDMRSMMVYNGTNNKNKFNQNSNTQIQNQNVVGTLNIDTLSNYYDQMNGEAIIQAANLSNQNSLAHDILKMFQARNIREYKAVFSDDSDLDSSTSKQATVTSSKVPIGFEIKIR